MSSSSKYHPLQSSIQLAEDLGSRLYDKITPGIVDQMVRESRIIKKGQETAVSIRKSVDPLVGIIDSYSSILLEWAEDKYRVIFYNNLMKIFSVVKDFYSSENNDYARICLRFLTLAIPDPTYMDAIYPEKFYESFKYDPQYNKESFQKILHHFYQHAKEHWLVNKNSKPLEIVRNALYVVANTMEDILVPHEGRIPFYAQKMADYFVNDSPSRTLFSRKHFRAFYKQLLNVEELDIVQQQLADQYLQIASVLFDLTNMSNKDLIDWTLHTFKSVKCRIANLKSNVQGTASAAMRLATQAVPTQTIKAAYDQVSCQAKTVYEIGKDGVVTIWNRFIDFHAVQYCLGMAHQLDLALRHNGKNLIEMYKNHEKVFMTFVKENRAEIRAYLANKTQTASKYSVQTKQALVEFLEKQEDKAFEIAHVGKDVAEMLYEVTADYSLYYKDRLSSFITQNYEILKDESKSLSKLVFEKLRIQEIAAFVLLSLRSVEEFLCIKESLSKLDLITNKCVTEVEQKQILSDSSSEEKPSN